MYIYISLYLVKITQVWRVNVPQQESGLGRPRPRERSCGTDDEIKAQAQQTCKQTKNSLTSKTLSYHQVLSPRFCRVYCSRYLFVHLPSIWWKSDLSWHQNCSQGKRRSAAISKRTGRRHVSRMILVRWLILCKVGHILANSWRELELSAIPEAETARLLLGLETPSSNKARCRLTRWELGIDWIAQSTPPRTFRFLDEGALSGLTTT